MVAPPIPHIQSRSAAPPRPQIVPQIFSTEETTLEAWLGMDGQTLPERRGPKTPGGSRSAAEEAAGNLLEGVRLLLAEESLFELWEGCLRQKTPVAAVIDCWQQLLQVR
jgi:hypothetical protein